MRSRIGYWLFYRSLRFRLVLLLEFNLPALCCIRIQLWSGRRVTNGLINYGGWSNPRKTNCWCFPCHDRIWKSRHSQVGQREIWEGGWILHFMLRHELYWTLLLWHGWEKPEQLIFKMHVRHNSEIALVLQFVWTCHAVLICFESPGTLTSTESTVNLNLRATLCSSCAMAEPPTVVDSRYFFHISLGVWPSALKTNLTINWCLPGDTSAQHVPSRIDYWLIWTKNTFVD